jgi:sec-independent protein translocase protein TatC
MAKKPHDDLFEGTTMTFGEHLEELRVCLFRSVIGIGLACAIGFFAANAVVRFFQGPLERAMQRFYLDKALNDLKEEFAEGVPVEVQRMILDEGLIPELQQMETGYLTDSLRLTYPEQFGNLDLSPFWFTEGDFFRNGAAELCQKLAAAGKSEAATPAHRIWQLLSTDQRQTVTRLAESKTPLTRPEVAQVLAVLNGIAARPELHDAPELAGLSGPDADAAAAVKTALSWLVGVKSIVAGDTVSDLRVQLKKQADPEVTRRLNKLLIARVFPESLHKARVSVLSLYTWRPVKVRFQVLNAQEAFMIWMKAALMTGLILASPYVFFQIWIFVAAGLYPHEKNYVYLYLPISVALFLGGASLAFVFVFDPVLDFLFLFNKGMNADFDPRIGEWLGFVLILPIGFGLSFQLPLVMLFLNRIGLVSLDLYIGQWRVAILVIFLVAMILTPADPISMMLMAVPLTLLYVLGIAMCRFMPRGRNPFDEAYEP